MESMIFFFNVLYCNKKSYSQLENLRSLSYLIPKILYCNHYYLSFLKGNCCKCRVQSYDCFTNTCLCSCPVLGFMFLSLYMSVPCSYPCLCHVSVHVHILFAFLSLSMPMSTSHVCVNVVFMYMFVSMF